jgi:protease PrsW
MTHNARVALVTGASAGIGRACADHLRRAGWAVTGASRRGTASGDWSGLVMDVDNDASVRDGVRHVLDAHGRIGALVAAAGWGVAGPVEHTTVGEALAYEVAPFGIHVTPAKTGTPTPRPRQPRRRPSRSVWRSGYAADVTPFDPRAVVGDRRPGHTRLGLILSVAAASLCALAALSAFAAGGALSAGIGLTLALLPIPALLSGLLYLDRLEPEPPGRLVFVFLWGAGAAAVVGLAGTIAGKHLITTPTLRPGGFAPASAAAIIGVAVLEETLKGVVLVWLLLRRPQEIDGTHDGVVYGSMVGLGFALIESIYYYAQATHFGFEVVATTFVYRGVLAAPCQALFTSLVGAGVAYAAMSRRRRGYWAVGVGWLAAVGLHALWNYALAAGVGRLALAYAALFAVFVILLITVIMDRRRIIALLRRYLPEYEPSGIVTALDVAMLSSMRDRRLARQWARLHCGLAGLREMSEYQLAATELGLLHRRAERDLVDDVSFGRRRDGLLAGMRTATSGLLGRLDGPARPPWAPHGPSCFRPPRPVRPAPEPRRSSAEPEPDRRDS